MSVLHAVKRLLGVRDASDRDRESEVLARERMRKIDEQLDDNELRVLRYETYARLSEKNRG